MNQKIQNSLYSARWGLNKAIEENDLTKLDYAADMIAQAKADYLTSDLEEPERPEEIPSKVAYEIPNIVEVPGIAYKKRGNFKTKTGKARGAVVHYTVSHGTPSSAKAVMQSLARRGLGCPVMDNEGTIYVPSGFDLTRDVAYHAGRSEWKGKTGISFYCIGLEICCWGRLTEKTKKYATEVRNSVSFQNIKAGDYECFTPAQEKSLVNFLLWQLDVNPEFSIDWIVGHDEIAPNRKTDPGASLSLSMPEFRAHLEKLT